jgi:hypothetical protein
LKEHKERTQKNAEKAKQAVDSLYPEELWQEASTLAFKNTGKGIGIPSGITGLCIAQSRLTGAKGDEKILSREIRQSKVLTDMGDSLYLLPKATDETGRLISGPDVIRNGVLYELKTVDGGIGRVEKNFRDSRRQCDNVYMSITNPQITKSEVLGRIRMILTSPHYTRGAEGTLILHFTGTGETSFIRIKELV